MLQKIFRLLYSEAKPNKTKAVGWRCVHFCSQYLMHNDAKMCVVCNIHTLKMVQKFSVKQQTLHTLDKYHPGVVAGVV